MTSSFMGQMHFERFGALHLAVLAAIGVVAVLLVVAGRRAHGTNHQRRLSRALALAILFVQGPLQLVSMLPANFDVQHSLPFQLCDLAWMLAVVALWTGRTGPGTIVYYWALSLTAQALVTPHLDYDCTVFEFVLFFYGHGIVVAAAIYLIWGLKHRPTWSDYRWTLAASYGYGVLMFAFNYLAGTNYMYLNHKPPVSSMFDYLGPWPVYLLIESLLAALIWAGMTWPWNLRSRGTTKLKHEQDLGATWQAQPGIRGRGIPHGEPAGRA